MKSGAQFGTELQKRQPTATTKQQQHHHDEKKGSLGGCRRSLRSRGALMGIMRRGNARTADIRRSYSPPPTSSSFSSSLSSIVIMDEKPSQKEHMKLLHDNNAVVIGMRKQDSFAAQRRQSLLQLATTTTRRRNHYHTCSCGLGRRSYKQEGTRGFFFLRSCCRSRSFATGGGDVHHSSSFF